MRRLFWFVPLVAAVLLAFPAVNAYAAPYPPPPITQSSTVSTSTQVGPMSSSADGPTSDAVPPTSGSSDGPTSGVVLPSTTSSSAQIKVSDESMSLSYTGLGINLAAALTVAVLVLLLGGLLMFLGSRRLRSRQRH